MRPWIGSIDQLGFVVRDLDACVRLFADQYGIYADHTELLGIYLELHKRPEDFQPPQIELRSYPEGLELHFGE